MARAGYGRIVNVSSGAGQLRTMSAYVPVYSMSRAALNAFTRILAHTYRGDGVLVNAVDRGRVCTDLGGPSAPRSPASRFGASRRIAGRVYCTPELTVLLGSGCNGFRAIAWTTLQHGPPAANREVPTLEAFSPRFVDGHARANRHKPSGIQHRIHPEMASGADARSKRLDAITNEQVRLKLALAERRRRPSTTC